MTDCLFCRIVRDEISADRVLENDEIIAFRDINPQAPTHVLVIPRRHVEDVASLSEEDGELVAALVAAVREVAGREGLRSYRVVSNVGPDAGQSVPHLHLHVLGGRQMGWPPG